MDDIKNDDGKTTEESSTESSNNGLPTTEVKNCPMDDTLSSKEVTSEDASSKDGVDGHGAVVAAHYNSLQEKGLAERNKSRIVYLRNFNNWIKSMLINEYMDLVKGGKSLGTSVRVLDMCCGKGGDLLKWRSASITHLICADIASTSVDQCQQRYEEMQSRQRRERRHFNSFTAEFIVADCTKMRLREQYKDASLKLDLVSCQFSFHYCFESLPQVECMLRNAAECLRAGGYFIGTIPDANEIVARYRKAGSKQFGNPVYKIEFEKDEPFPLFGAKYNFTLVDVVDCPEFLVHFPTFERIARKYGLELVEKLKFSEFYEKHKESGRSLLGKMQAFETFPAFEGHKLNGEDDEYSHAKDYMDKKEVERVGTLSLSEWEAASLYLAFGFRKMKPITLDAHGMPVYEIKSAKYRAEVQELIQKRLQEEMMLGLDVPSPKRVKGDSTT